MLSVDTKTVSDFSADKIQFETQSEILAKLFLLIAQLKLLTDVLKWFLFNKHI